MDTMSFERVYDSFQKFHAFFAASFGPEGYLSWDSLKTLEVPTIVFR